MNFSSDGFNFIENYLFTAFARLANITNYDK